MDIIKKKISSSQAVTFFIDGNNQSFPSDLDLAKYDKSIIFCDKKLKKIYFDFIKKIKPKNLKTKPIFISSNEKTKSILKLPFFLNKLEKRICSRSDIIIAIGGGTITDMIGFSSSIYMRGVDLFLVPTTLMGQADATTAGKTCINSLSTKNIIGTYYLPKFVYANINYLENLPSYEFRQGISEIFKYGLLGSKKLITDLETFTKNKEKKLISKILKETIRVRISLRKKNGLISNLGHTFGHAFEKTSNYKVAHGDAISVGIILALKFSLDRKIISVNFYNRIYNIMKKLNLNMHIDSKFNINKIIEVMLKDKKSREGKIGLVLIKDISKILTSVKNPFFYVDVLSMKNFLNNNLKSFSKKNHWVKLK